MAEWGKWFYGRNPSSARIGAIWFGYKPIEGTDQKRSRKNLMTWRRGSTDNFRVRAVRSKRNGSRRSRY